MMVMYMILAAKVLALIFFFVKRTEPFMLATGILQYISEPFQEICEITYSSFVTFWPMYMSIFGLMELMIFLSFHHRIYFKPFRIDGSIEGFKKTNNRCNKFDKILEQSADNGPGYM
ncbi:hypothetical protein RF11_09417 [Thelohanellus kitauei]|uniref:Uncharacterized protein n=1 Tax=Thelohanellus kitauei TaxID=669202 RepID=A0A0C2JW58_THEKT|nr:hypothetical protein RF11_09417 [Thelohanellus kitauei]